MGEKVRCIRDMGTSHPSTAESSAGMGHFYRLVASALPRGCHRVTAAVETGQPRVGGHASHAVTHRDARLEPASHADQRGRMQHRQAGPLRVELRLDDLTDQRLAAAAARGSSARLRHVIDGRRSGAHTAPDLPVGDPFTVTHNHRRYCLGSLGAVKPE